MAVTPPGLVGATANRPTARNPLTVNGIRPWVAVAARCILLLLLLRRSEGACEHRPHCDQFGGSSIVVRMRSTLTAARSPPVHFVDDEDTGVLTLGPRWGGVDACGAAVSCGRARRYLTGEVR